MTPGTILPDDLLLVETEQAESRQDHHRLGEDEEDGGDQDHGHVVGDQLEEKVQTALRSVIMFNGAKLADGIYISTKRIIANNIEITSS